MSTQLVAIFVVLGGGLLFLVFAWYALAVSGREERDQQGWLETMAAMGWQEWPAEASANADYSDGSEHDDG